MKVNFRLKTKKIRIDFSKTKFFLKQTLHTAIFGLMIGLSVLSIIMYASQAQNMQEGIKVCVLKGCLK